MVVFRPYSGKVYDRKGVYFVLIPAIISTACAMVLIGFGKTLAVMIAASLFNALGQGAGVPTLQADVIRKLDKSRTGVATSTIQIGQNIGNALAPMAGSFMVKALGYQAMYLSAATLITLAGFFLLFLQRLKEVRH